MRFFHASARESHRLPSRKNPERNCREPWEPKFWLRRCSCWWATLGNPADRWQSVCALIAEWMCSTEERHSLHKQLTPGGWSEYWTFMRECQTSFYLSKSNNHCDTDLLACIHQQLTCDCLWTISAQSGQVIDRRWDQILEQGWMPIASLSAARRETLPRDARLWIFISLLEQLFPLFVSSKGRRRRQEPAKVSTRL